MCEVKTSSWLLDAVQDATSISQKPQTSQVIGHVFDDHTKGDLAPSCALWKCFRDTGSGKRKILIWNCSSFLNLSALQLEFIERLPFKDISRLIYNKDPPVTPNFNFYSSSIYLTPATDATGTW